jgi:hypothetical protein
MSSFAALEGVSVNHFRENAPVVNWVRVFRSLRSYKVTLNGCGESKRCLEANVSWYSSCEDSPVQCPAFQVGVGVLTYFTREEQ